MKTFNIPAHYKSSIISRIKELRKIQDPKKKDLTPALLDFGPVRFLIARHFGFCFGVENAIEISQSAVEENPGKRIFLLSQMIHNPDVNADLQEKGINFIMDTQGKQLIEWKEITSDDIVLIPAFGTTLETEKILKEKGIETQKYNTTCPFVERVWKKSEKLGSDKHTIIIHGKHNHEETKATFSHSQVHGPSLVIKDLEDAKKIESYILGQVSANDFYEAFRGRFSNGFDCEKDLQKIGVVNQTTMLATETQQIADFLKNTMIKKYGAVDYKDHFSDTRDTLCYATNDNQDATYGLLKEHADLAIVVGGYNSSNTSHLVELCERKFATYFISSHKEIESRETINHFDYHNQKQLKTNNFLPSKSPLTIIVTSGASCPDSVVENVIQKLLSFFEAARSIDEVISEIKC
ncbi:MAG: 4-hydroxy-3-methylbut-2-enyl diphosphate reductase [Bacteroidetes bacterium]|nr:4-hydroxy-3-methylbut-2-enyl diphosphate reductase [Bacteroidota bacterium]HET6244255.1 4-hydroxy-3-methylbut-2-enyl diphosphate reductase [Bacteroidia bacterium]